MKDFKIIYKGWKPEEQRLREALCTLGNGYFATRGAAEERSADDFNYPGTYLAGGFNRAKTMVSDKTIENEDFVNFPNWLCLNFRPADGAWLNLDHFKVLDYKQTLNMKTGLLIREFRVEDDQGRRTHIKSRRVVSMRDMHMAAIQWQLTPENWSGVIELYSALDGTVINAGVDRYKDLESRHLEADYVRQTEDNSMLLKVKTRQSKLAVAQAARTRIYSINERISPETETHQEEMHISQHLRFKVTEGTKYVVEKMVAVYTSRDRACTECSSEACTDIIRVGRFKELYHRHKHAYKTLWHRADIGVINGDKNQQLLRLHIFHVLQTVSLNTLGLDVGVPSRGLHGEAYRGHIFWDELYIFPFLNLRFPEITRSLLMYRYYRLDEARYAASEEGYKGAIFPWQSGSNGREESQVMHLNPKSGRWMPDTTHLQRHVNSAIAYNVWSYFQATDDHQFLSYFGAEIIFSIASYWASKAQYNEDRGRYEIHGVVGPDEYHTSYPGSDQSGLNNNAYTNVMAAWVLQTAIEVYELMEEFRRNELMKELQIDEQELSLWREIGQKMYVPVKENGLIDQFEGYDELEEFPWKSYREKYTDIHRLDRLLESEGDSPNNYKASKQADVLMLFYMFSKDELDVIFKQLGYEFTDEMIHKNIEYYRKRTSHGSTLSRLVFSWILSKYDQKKSWKDFETLLISDFEDIQGGTTTEGIHLGAMAGSLNLIQRCYSGIDICDDVLWVKPDLPEYIQKISMRVNYRSHWIALTIDHKKLKIVFEEGHSNQVRIGVVDKVYEFKHGEVREFSLTS